MGFTCYCINLRIIASFARLTIGTLDSIYIARVSAFAKDSGMKHICYLIRNHTSRDTQRNKDVALPVGSCECLRFACERPQDRSAPGSSPEPKRKFFFFFFFLI